MKNNTSVWISNSIRTYSNRLALLCFFALFMNFNITAQDHINMDFVFISSNSTQADFDVILTNDGTTTLKFNSIVMRGDNDAIANIATAGSVVTCSALQNNTNPAWSFLGNVWPGNGAVVTYNQNGPTFKLNFSSDPLFFPSVLRPNLPIGTSVNIGRFRLSIAGGSWIPNSQLNFTWHALAGVICENASGTLITLNSSPSTITRIVSINQPLNPTPPIGVISGNDTICANVGSANISVAVTGGSSPYQLVYTNGTTNDTILNYLSGTPITVSPAVNTTFTLVSINDSIAGHSGSAVITMITTPPVPDSASLATVISLCSVSSIPPPTATSICYGAITGTPDLTFPILGQGSSTVTWTFDDGNGNTSTQTQQVIITDTTAPVPDIASLPNLSGNCSLSLTPPTAIDICEGTITATTSTISPITTAGLTVVTWIYDDGNGNTVTQTQNVTLNAPDASVTQTGATLTANSLTASYQWLDCDNSYAIIPGATSQSFSPSILNGNYALKATEFGCTDTSICYNVDFTGLEETIQNVAIQIYPNPSVGIFNVDLFGLNNEPLDMQIVDLTGRLILWQKLENISGTSVQKLDISENENGIYILNLILNKRVVQSKRIIKY